MIQEMFEVSSASFETQSDQIVESLTKPHQHDRSYASECSHNPRSHIGSYWQKQIVTTKWKDYEHRTRERLKILQYVH